MPLPAAHETPLAHCPPSSVVRLANPCVPTPATVESAAADATKCFALADRVVGCFHQITSIQHAGNVPAVTELTVVEIISANFHVMVLAHDALNLGVMAVFPNDGLDDVPQRP